MGHAISKSNMHTISLLVANKPGVLVRCAQVFARRGFNIDSLVVSPGFNPKYSRMTITLTGNPSELDQIIKQTNKLIDVIHCSEHTRLDALSQELALVKVKYSSSKNKAIGQLIKKFHAKVLDKSDGALIIEQIGSTDQLDKFEVFLKKFGVIEMVRSGKLVMAKGKEPT